MGRQRFASESIARKLRECGGLCLDQAKRLKELERENIQLRKLVANEALDISILKEASSGN